VDTFVRDRLPPPDLLPLTDWTALPELADAGRLNCATALLDRWAAGADGGRIVFHHTGGAWTYRRLYETANRIAHVLVRECGLAPGGRVLLRSPNHPMLAACWLAVMKAGGVAVATMPLLRVRELTAIVDKAGVTLALSDSDVAGDLESVMALRPGTRVVHFNAGAPRAHSESLEMLMARHPSEFTNVPTAADDPAIIAFTSGTTGRPKGTVHGHRDLLAVADTYGRQIIEPSPDDVFIGTPPLAFTYALGGLILFPLRVGASTALIENATPSLLLEGIARYRATIAITSPTAYRAMLPHAGECDLSSLRKCVSAGETLPAATFNAWLDATGIRIMDGIGSTELLHVFIGCRAEDARPGSTGRVVPGYRARVIDDRGEDVAPGSVGRLAVTGPTGCRYLDDLESQRTYVESGWNLTGDAYRMDRDGYFWYESRTDDLIITSGYNVAGPEVENVLLTHPAVTECAVVGVADEARGQIVKAFIVPAAGASPSDALVCELQDYVKAQIAPYKYPRAIEFVDSLPRTLTGKIQRFRLRTAEAERRPAGSPLVLHQPEGWPRPSGYANAVSGRGRTVMVSGQVGMELKAGRITSTDFPTQVKLALENVVTALGAAGAGPEHIARLTWYVTDRDAYLASRRAIGEHYRAIVGRHYPAMSVVFVAGLVDAGALVEIEATAIVPE
jgi:2-aminobenzoate-CoA ligase